jgi:hypothetical protein
MTRVLTWHVHGNYLLYLAQADVELVVPVVKGRRHPYGGRAGTFPWPDNLVEIPLDDVRDVVLHHSLGTWRSPPERPRHRVLWAGRIGDPHSSSTDPGLLEIGVEDVRAAVTDLLRD